METTQENEETRDALRSGRRVHVADIETSTEPADQYLEAAVILVWPYSSSTGELSLLLAERDVVLRKATGQVKVTFHGLCAREVAQTRIGIGESLKLSLENVQVIRESDEVSTPGKKANFTLHYNTAVQLEISHTDGSTQQVNLVPLPSPTITAFSSPVRNGHTNGYNTPQHESSTYNPHGMLPTKATPAIRTGPRVSSNSFPGSFVDPFTEEDGSTPGRGRKRTKFARHSGAWRLADLGDESIAVESENNNLTPASEPASNQVIISPMEQEATAATSTTLPSAEVSGATEQHKLEQQNIADIEPDHELASIEHLSAPDPQDPLLSVESPAKDKQRLMRERPSLGSDSMPTPRIQALASPGLPLVSPLYQRSDYFPRFERQMSELDASAEPQGLLQVPLQIDAMRTAINEPLSSQAIESSQFAIAPSPAEDLGPQSAVHFTSTTETEVDLDALQQQIELENAPIFETPVFPDVVEDEDLYGPPVISKSGPQSQIEVQPVEHIMQKESPITLPIPSPGKAAILDDLDDDDQDLNLIDFQGVHNIERNSVVSDDGDIIGEPGGYFSSMQSVLLHGRDETLDAPSEHMESTSQFTIPPQSYSVTFDSKEKTDDHDNVPHVNRDASTDTKLVSPEVYGHGDPDEAQINPGIMQGSNNPMEVEDVEVEPQSAANQNIMDVSSDDTEEPPRLRFRPASRQQEDYLGFGFATERAFQATDLADLGQSGLPTAQATQSDLQQGDGETATRNDLSEELPPTSADTQQIFSAERPHTTGGDSANDRLSAPVEEVAMTTARKIPPRTTTASSLPGSVYSDYFTPRKSAPTSKIDRSPRRTRSSATGEEEETVSSQPVVSGRDNETLQSASPNVLGVTEMQADPVPPPLLSRGASTHHTYFANLSSLRDHFNQFVDVLAISVEDTYAPERAKAGPKDYFTTFHLADSSLNSDGNSTIQVQIFRPRRNVIPILRRGDVMLMRNFKVQSQSHKMSLLSHDSSAWAVFHLEAATDDQASRISVTVSGPPVEFGDAEEKLVNEIFEWWARDGQSLFSERPASEQPPTDQGQTSTRKTRRTTATSDLDVRRSPRAARNVREASTDDATLGTVPLRSPTFVPISPTRSLRSSIPPPSTSVVSPTSPTSATRPRTRSTTQHLRSLSATTTGPMVALNEEDELLLPSAEETRKSPGTMKVRSNMADSSATHNRQAYGLDGVIPSTPIADAARGDDVHSNSASTRRHRHERRSIGLVHELRDGTQWVDVEETEVVSVSASEQTDDSGVEETEQGLTLSKANDSDDGEQVQRSTADARSFTGIQDEGTTIDETTAQGEAQPVRMKGSTNNTTELTPARRGRGRPRKEVETESDASPMQTHEEPRVTPGTRPRGRPRMSRAQRQASAARKSMTAVSEAGESSEVIATRSIDKDREDEDDVNDNVHELRDGARYQD
ncbi:hypothetical protein LTS08_004692 [Lithohypha guttulata]|nr:hypothetical protein LTS08_004692 [Lithohypha guttulata]